MGMVHKTTTLIQSSSEESTDEDTQTIPQEYLSIIDHIDEFGWDSLEWDDGYTLLHWAAKQNMTGLCARFLVTGAKADQKDARGKSAIDYADEAGALAALAQLRSGPPSDEPAVLMIPISNKHRPSQLVR